MGGGVQGIINIQKADKIRSLTCTREYPCNVQFNSLTIMMMTLSEISLIRGGRGTLTT